MNWIETTVGEYCPFVYGKSLHKAKREPGTVPVYGSNGCIGHHSKSYVKGPGIIIGRKGNIGTVHLSKQPFWPIDTSFYTEKPSVQELQFVFYLLKSLSLEDMNSDSAVPGLNRENVHSLPIRIPESEQDRKVLGEWIAKFDDKIILNTQTNQTLEQIAQAIFKSWFVDFEPVKAKIAVLEAGGTTEDAEYAAMCVISGKDKDTLKQLHVEQPETYSELAQTAFLFPAAMQDSEVGDIPEGWSLTNFGQVSDCFDSKRIPLSKKQREEKKPGVIPYYGATSVVDFINEWIFGDTYLLIGEDGSVIRDDGTPFVQYIWGKTWVNNHAHVLKGKKNVSTEQLMLFMRNTNISSYVTGAVQLKINQKNMNSIPFVLSDGVVNVAFGKRVVDLYRLYKKNIEENDKLVAIRDAILPKLLVGELI